ncbi:hypothetical protein ANCCAN_18622 [Ancylostoma caninum]|uniref:Uncharacterized protein n=1 Tax=Ancylostoma caninum TaxID=29170 RepID=A0A368FTJ8_ANCCA|nr:hypothetical protein ANCCAN_18622 [Ancylostoma caninum]
MLRRSKQYAAEIKKIKCGLEEAHRRNSMFLHICKLYYKVASTSREFMDCRNLWKFVELDIDQNDDLFERVSSHRSCSCRVVFMLQKPDKVGSPEPHRHSSVATFMRFRHYSVASQKQIRRHSHADQTPLRHHQLASLKLIQ